MIDRTTTRAAPHEMTAFIQKQLNVTFGVWVLVVADDNSTLVFPKVQSDFPFQLMLNEILFNGAVEKGIVLVADDVLEWHE